MNASLSGTGRLADDLHLLAHDDVTGRPRLQPRAAGLGLAGALLAELIVSGGVWLAGDLIGVTRRVPSGDVLLASIQGLIAAEPGRPPVRDWLAFLARTATADVAVRLEGAGYLVPVAGRRPRRSRRWVPVDRDCAFAPMVRVKQALDPWVPATGHNAALAGLVSACGLAHHLTLYLPPGTGRRLEDIALRLDPPFRELVAHTRAAVDSAVLARRT